MNDLTTAFSKLLLSDTAITDLVGSAVFADQLPQGVKSKYAIVFNTITESANDHLSGPLGFDLATVQVDCYSKTRSDANQLRLTVRGVVAGYAGTMDATYIKGISQSTGYATTTDRVLAGTDQYRFVATQDFLVSYCSMDTV